MAKAKIHSTTNSHTVNSCVTTSKGKRENESWTSGSPLLVPSPSLPLPFPSRGNHDHPLFYGFQFLTSYSFTSKVPTPWFCYFRELAENTTLGILLCLALVAQPMRRSYTHTVVTAGLHSFHGCVTFPRVTVAQFIDPIVLQVAISGPGELWIKLLCTHLLVHVRMHFCGDITRRGKLFKQIMPNYFPNWSHQLPHPPAACEFQKLLISSRRHMASWSF